MAAIFRLPLEVLLYILDFTEWRDLLRLTCVSNFFHALVEEITSLQYKIELGVHGLADSRRGPDVPYPKRLKHLRDFQSNWRTASFARVSEVSLPGTWDGWTYELQKGFFARSLLNQNQPIPDGHSEMVLVNLRTAAHWRCELDLEVQDFSFDPDQNLAVLFQWMGLDPDTAETRIHLRQLNDLKPHPLAEQPIITYDLGWRHRPLGWTIHSIQISGDLVGVLFDPRSFAEGDKVVVWNWRTGKAIAELPSTRLVGLDSFALLSERIIVVPDARQPSINVFLLRDEGKRPVHWKCFVLPRLAADRRMERIICRSDPVASAIPASSPKCPTDRNDAKLTPGPTYRVSSESRLLCFVINIWKFDADIVNTVHLFTPMETFMPSPEGDWNQDHGVKYVPWKDWGPKMTRMMAEPTLARNPFVTFIHGHRFVMASNQLEAGDALFGNMSQHIHVYDFNQTAIRRDLLRNAKVDDIESTPSTLCKDDFFGTVDVVTSLPYRCCCRRLDVMYEALMMDGENVIALSQQRGESGALDVLYIHQIGPLE